MEDPENRQASAKHLQNGKATSADEDDFKPPDGGSRAWLVMVGSFFCNGILFGVINSYGVLQTEFAENLKQKNDSSASSKAALVGSLALGTTFLVSPISGVLTDSIGLRSTTFIGGLTASGGMLLSSFVTDNVQALYFTYGIMYGFGGALAYTPSLAILGHYFKKYMGIVNGVVTAGSSSFTVVMPYVIDFFLKRCGVEWTFRVMALFAGCIMLLALLFKPVNRRKRKSRALMDVFNVSIWKNKKYVVWAILTPLSLFGYFVPYVHMLQFVGNNFSKDFDGKIPVTCIGITSGLGRVLFGYIADKPRVNRILLQQISFFCIGLLTLLLPTTVGCVPWLITVTLGMGIFDGCFISLLGPVAFDLCGHEGATQAIGFLLGLCSIPLTLGPYVAGLIYDATKSYDLAFRLAGIPPIAGALAMFLIRFVNKPGDTHRTEERQGGAKGGGQQTKLMEKEHQDGRRDDS